MQPGGLCATILVPGFWLEWLNFNVGGYGFGYTLPREEARVKDSLDHGLGWCLVEGRMSGDEAVGALLVTVVATVGPLRPLLQNRNERRQLGTQRAKEKQHQNFHLQPDFAHTCSLGSTDSYRTKFKSTKLVSYTASQNLSFLTLEALDPNPSAASATTAPPCDLRGRVMQRDVNRGVRTVRLGLCIKISVVISVGNVRSGHGLGDAACYPNPHIYKCRSVYDPNHSAPVIALKGISFTGISRVLSTIHKAEAYSTW